MPAPGTRLRRRSANVTASALRPCTRAPATQARSATESMSVIGLHHASVRGPLLISKCRTCRGTCPRVRTSTPTIPTTWAASTSLLRSSPIMYISSGSTPRQLARGQKPPGADFSDLLRWPARWRSFLSSRKDQAHAGVDPQAVGGGPTRCCSMHCDHRHPLRHPVVDSRQRQMAVLRPAPPSSTTSVGLRRLRPGDLSSSRRCRCRACPRLIWPLLTREAARVG